MFAMMISKPLKCALFARNHKLGSYKQNENRVIAFPLSCLRCNYAIWKKSASCSLSRLTTISSKNELWLAEAQQKREFLLQGYYSNKGPWSLNLIPRLQLTL